MPGFVTVARVGELPPGSARQVTVEGLPPSPVIVQPSCVQTASTAVRVFRLRIRKVNYSYERTKNRVRRFLA
jgi:hypothetical protein